MTPERGPILEHVHHAWATIPIPVGSAVAGPQPRLRDESPPFCLQIMQDPVYVPVLACPAVALSSEHQVIVRNDRQYAGPVSDLSKLTPIV